MYLQVKEGAYAAVLAELKQACEKAGVTVHSLPVPKAMQAPLRVLRDAVGAGSVGPDDERRVPAQVAQVEHVDAHAPVEAQAIVNAVHDLVRGSSTPPSIGIVTFNEQQRQLISDLLTANEDPAVIEVLDDALGWHSGYLKTGSMMAA